MLTFFAMPTGFKRELGSTLGNSPEIQRQGDSVLQHHIRGAAQLTPQGKTLAGLIKFGLLPITQRGTPLPRAGSSCVPLLRFFTGGTHHERNSIDPNGWHHQIQRIL